MPRSGDGLLCYTTEILPEKTVMEIKEQLKKVGVKGVLEDYDETGISGLSFIIPVNGNDVSFRLPLDTEKVVAILKEQALAGKIPRRFIGDKMQARRVGWRIIQRWVEAQIAIIQLKQVKPEQVFLPYAVAKDGRTLFQMFEENQFKMLPGKED